nr:uncharacterized protein LOC118037019 [Populus alba]
MGCMTYRGKEDAKVTGHWLRKVERVINQMQVPEELRVDCVTQLLIESVHSWWETIRERRSSEVLRWRDFREEFEERYYSWEHRREKEHEFLDLMQGDLIVLEYEKRFQDLVAFSSTYLPTKCYRVDRFYDGLRQELRMILIATQFQYVRELVRAAQGGLLSQKKGRAGNHQNNSKGKVGVSPKEVAQEDIDRSVEKDIGEDRLDRESKLLEGLQSRKDQYIHSVRGVSSDTLEIALRSWGDVMFIEERGIDGESSRM